MSVIPKQTKMTLFNDDLKSFKTTGVFLFIQGVKKQWTLDPYKRLISLPYHYHTTFHIQLLNFFFLDVTWDSFLLELIRLDLTVPNSISHTITRPMIRVS